MTSSLLYTNNETSPIEAEFTFPIDDSSAVFRFEAEIEGRHIVAEIQEKEQAKLTYDDAINRGSTAMLLKEEDRVGDIFQCTLGNLPPQTDARVIFSFVIELPQEPDGKIRFTLPTVLNPRYSSAARSTTSAEGAVYSLPQTIPYHFSMGATIRGSSKVLSVTSVRDKLNVESPDGESTVIALAEEFKFDHDLSFLVEYDNCYTPQVILEKGNAQAAGMMKEDLLMVNFYPELQETAMTSSGEYIFVIDRSGSMRGQKMKDAREALFLFLKSLPADCYFNIVSFGSSCRFLFQHESSKYTEESLSEALALQNSMDANMGGTEIYRPLRNIFSKNTIKGHPRQVFLLTDGEVYDTEKVIGLVASNSHNTRVFTLGIGSGVSTSLIKGVARAGNGRAEFIADNHRIQPKVVSLLKCATQPSLSEIEIKWNLPKAKIPVPIPKQPPGFINVGERLCLYALLSGQEPEDSAEPCSVSITGRCDGRQVEHSISFSLTSKTQRNQKSPLHRLAAKAQIKILETEEAELIDKEGFDANNRRHLAKLGQDILSLSTNANIVSKMTAFVAIDKESKKQVEGVMVKRPCPVPLATSEMLASPGHRKRKRGGGGYRGGRGGGSEQRSRSRSRSRSPTRSPTFAYSDRCYREFADSELPKIRGDVRSHRRLNADTRRGSERSGTSRSSLPNRPVGDQMLEIIGLQQLTGYWKHTNNLKLLLHVSDHMINMIKSSNVLQDEDVIITLAVIAWLRSKFNKRHDEWEMIEKKAVNWLKSKLNRGENIKTLVEEVKKQLWPDSASLTT